MQEIHEYIVEKICPKCGKNFVPAPEHVFKDYERVYCSWTCFNHRNDDKLKKQWRKRVIQYDLNWEPIQIFDSVREAAASVKGDADRVYNACRQYVKYNGYHWAYEEDEK